MLGFGKREKPENPGKTGEPGEKPLGAGTGVKGRRLWIQTEILTYLRIAVLSRLWARIWYFGCLKVRIVDLNVPAEISFSLSDVPMSRSGEND